MLLTVPLTGDRPQLVPKVIQAQHVIQGPSKNPFKRGGGGAFNYCNPRGAKYAIKGEQDYKTLPPPGWKEGREGVQMSPFLSKGHPSMWAGHVSLVIQGLTKNDMGGGGCQGSTKESFLL